MRPVGDAHLVLAPLLVPAFPEELVVLDVGVNALGLQIGVVSAVLIGNRYTKEVTGRPLGARKATPQKSRDAALYCRDF